MLPILALACVLRTAVAVAAVARNTYEQPDTNTYLVPAMSLVTHGRFESNGAPELARTPGYPVFLAVAELLGDMVLVTLGLQVLLGTLTVWWVARLARAMGTGPTVAALAAGLYAVEPLAVIYTAKVMTESLFVAAVVAMLLLFTVWTVSGRLHTLIAAAALLAVACFVRPVLYYAPPLLAGVAGVVAWRRHGRGARALVPAVLFFAVATVPLAAWQARNVRVAGYTGFSAITDVNLLYYRAAAVVALRSGQQIEEVQRTWNHAGHDVLTGRDPATRASERSSNYRDMRARARNILVNDPAAVFRVTLAGLARTMVGPGTAEWALLAGVTESPGPRLLVTVLLSVFLFPVLALAAVGLYSRRWDVMAAGPALATSTYLLVVSAGAEAYSRFRHPLMPVLCIFAASGAAYVMGHLRVAGAGTPQAARTPAAQMHPLR
jgi:4-amino-4-deoxy-L-arabinose transferase-like glycosyltransferase